MVKVLVAGGHGFVGRHLVDYLLGRKQDVIAVSKGSLESRNASRLLEPSGRVSHVYADVAEPMFLEVDAIYNLASPATPIQHQKDPISTLRSNVLGTWNLLELATKLQVPIFQASTSEVYGNAEVSPQPESYFGNVSTFDDRSSYTESKRLAETLCFEYLRTKGTRVKVARIFSTYGPGMSLSGGRAVSNFILQALKNKPISIVGDGSQSRSFTYISDIVSGITALMDHADPTPTPINIGSSESVSLLELAQIIVDLTNSTSDIRLVSSQASAGQAVIPDITLATNTLDWRPTITLREGLKLTIEDFDFRLRAKLDGD